MFSNISKHEAELFVKFKTSYDFGAEPGFRFVLDYYNDLFLDNNILSKGPVQVGLNITNNCNLRCKHCSRIGELNKVGNTKPSYMTQWEEIIDKLYECDVFQIFITGGEPLTHPDIKNIISKIKGYNMLIGLLTNGLLIDESMIDFLQASFSSPFDYVHLSIDGLYDNYNNLRVGGNFKKLINSINLLVKANIRTHAVMVVSDANYLQMWDVYKFCIHNNIKYLKFMSLFEHPHTNFKFPNDDIILKEFCKILEHYEKEKPNIKIICEPLALIYPFAIWLKNNYPDISFPTGNHVCPAANSSCEISVEGNVYPCAYLEEPKFYAGNILKSGLDKIWQEGINWSDLRLRTLDNETCKGCDEKDTCFGGCPASSYFKQNNFNYGDSKCLLLRK